MEENKMSYLNEQPASPVGNMDDTAENVRKRKIALIKIAAIAVLFGMILLRASIAWFTMSTEVEGSNAQMTASDALFELKVIGSKGLYDRYITDVDSSYSDHIVTSNSTQKIMWRLTAEPDEYDGNMDNLYSGTDTPDLAEITKLDSSDYGLSPGKHGFLKFYIVPNTENRLSIEINTILTCYKTEYYKDTDTEGEAGYQKDVFTKMLSSNSDDALALRYISSHILFFYLEDKDNDGTEEMHLIKNASFFRNGINAETEVTIYWVWPKTLNDIIDLSVTGLDSTGNLELREYFFAEPGRMLDNPLNVDFSSITVAETDENRVSKITEIVNNLHKASNRTEYSNYGSMYNNADQIIGDKVGYIMFEIIADKVN